MKKTNKNPNSLGAYIVSHYDELGKCKTSQEVVNFVEKGRNPTNSAYVDEVIKEINGKFKFKPAARAIDYVGRNVVLAGEGLRANI